MKTYAQFKVLSNGYIEGTIPPKFSEENKYPIDKLGSDGVYILDSRKSLHSMVKECENKMKGNIIGFEIIKANSFLDKGRVIYSSLKQ